MKPRIPALAAALLLGALAAAPAGAASHPAIDIESCFEDLARGHTKKATEGFRRLFEDWKGHPDVVRNLDRIEEGLKEALWGDLAKPLTVKDVLGPAATSFDSDTLEVELEFSSFREADGWSASRRKEYLLYEADMQGAVIVSWKVPSRGSTRALLFWNDEASAGYEASPGGGQIFIHRPGEPPQALTLSRLRPETSEEGAFVNGEEVGLTRGRYLLGSTRDSTWRRGRIGISNPPPGWVELHGFLAPDWFRKKVRRARRRAIEEWAEKNYDREKEIPIWVRDAVRMSGGHYRGPAPAREDVALLLGLALGGNETARNTIRFHGERTDLQAPVDAYVLAARELLDGKNAAAHGHAATVLAAKPDWAGAHALAGVALCRLRRRAEAEAALKRALELAPESALAWYGRAQLDLQDYDLEATLATVRAAGEAGAESPWIDSARELLEHAVAGPGWKDAQTVATSHFEIRSPESRDLCRTVAHTLESALRDYTKFFPSSPATKKKARVYVFRDRKEYLDWSRSSGRDAEHSIGVYSHLLRELSFYRGGQKEWEFLRVVRHEGFHRFCGLYLDETPIWMNEGCAEYFSHCREKFGGGIDPGEVDRDAVRLLRLRRGSLTPLRKLLVMDGEEFMADASVHYAQAWAVIYYMFETEFRRLRPVFRAYFQSLCDGRTPEEAFAEHLEPEIDRIEANYLDIESK